MYKKATATVRSRLMLIAASLTANSCQWQQQHSSCTLTSWAHKEGGVQINQQTGTARLEARQLRTT